MSTKQTIRHGDGFHLYTDVFDTAGLDGKGPVYLSLDGCDFAVFTEAGKSGVTVKLSEDMATRLGLIGWEGMAKWR